LRKTRRDTEKTTLIFLRKEEIVRGKFSVQDASRRKNSPGKDFLQQGRKRERGRHSEKKLEREILSEEKEALSYWRKGGH